MRMGTQTIINCLLAWDAFFAWYYPYQKSIPFRCPMEVREARALDNVRKAIDMHEAFEKVSINNHKSFLPHLAIFKVIALPAPNACSSACSTTACSHFCACLVCAVFT